MHSETDVFFYTGRFSIRKRCRFFWRFKENAQWRGGRLGHAAQAISEPLRQKCDVDVEAARSGREIEKNGRFWTVTVGDTDWEPYPKH